MIAPSFRLALCVLSLIRLTHGAQSAIGTSRRHLWNAYHVLESRS